MKNPGISRNTPQTYKVKGSKISKPGLTCNIDFRAWLKDETPTYFIVAAPIKAVNKVKRMVEAAPISDPILTKK